MRTTCLLVFAIVVAVDSEINLNSFEEPTNVFIQRASYSDVLKALYLVDFNLNLHERTVLELMLFGIRNLTREESSGISTAVEFDRAVIRSVALVKLKNGVEPVPHDAKLNGLMLVMNYDLIGQILDPEFEHTPGITIPIKKGKNYGPFEEMALNMFSRRWSPRHLTHAGVQLPEGGLKNFFEGSDEEVESRKKQVYRLYKTLDEFVLKTLNDAKMKYQENIYTSGIPANAGFAAFPVNLQP